MKQIKALISVFLLWTVIGTISKIFFMLILHSTIGGISVAEFFLVLWHGLVLDTAIAGYLSIIPALLLIATVWTNNKAVEWIWRIYFAIVSLLAVLAYVSNIVLYKYWFYPLDNTPLLYVKTSPKDAMASGSIWLLLLALVCIITLATLVAYCFYKLYPKEGKQPKARIIYSIVVLLLGGLMFIPIRGGFGTGTNHTGSVYFSDNLRLNHAAVNPIFSFVESIDHQRNLGAMYRFMDDKQATQLQDSLLYTQLRNDSVEYLTNSKPNVIVIMLESFSKYIMEEGGRVHGVTPCLDALTNEGIYFDHFYVNSVRTDRAMVAIQSAFPAQPTMSIMDIPHKSTTLPSIARTLDKHGYTTTFYYGGDTNFSNMRSYFMGTGFENIVSEYDFPPKDRLQKWGVPDGIMYNKMLEDIKAFKGQRFYFSLMTESSHEPFDVPYKSSLKEEELNAFAYADHCLGEFIKELKKLPCWQNTVVVIVPDHLGAYPRVIDNYALWRYESALVFTGGAIKEKMRVNTIACQTDIAATLLGMMHIDHSDFAYSRDIMDKNAPHFAFFTVDDGMGMANEQGSVIYDNISNKVIVSNGQEASNILLRTKAYLQKLFDDINAR